MIQTKKVQVIRSSGKAEVLTKRQLNRLNREKKKESKRLNRQLSRYVIFKDLVVFGLAGLIVLAIILYVGRYENTLVHPQPQQSTAPNAEDNVVLRNNEIHSKVSDATERAAVAGLLARWLTAWRNEDVDSYVGAYIVNYTPNTTLTHTGWLKNSIDLLIGANITELKIANLQLNRQDDNTIIASFLKSFRASGKQRFLNKILELKKLGDSWFITKEVDSK